MNAHGPNMRTRSAAHLTGGQITVDPARRRAFLYQTFAERARGFWWGVVWAVLFRRTPPFMNAWRIFLLRRFGATVGRGVHIPASTRIQFPWNLRIDDDVVIAHGVIITAMGTIHIGPRTRISQYAHLIAGTHDYQRQDMRILREPIDIGSDVWIAADAFVGPGVSVGDGALLAARSSAFNDLPAGQVCMGEPARPVKPREADES